MQRLKNAARAGLLVLVAGCAADAGSPLDPAADPVATISDDAHAGTVPGFYFLPPMVSQPAYSGIFDGGVQPRVEVCELAGSSCETAIAQWTMASGVTVSVSAEQYQVNWHTNQFDLDPAKHYRVSVFVGSSRLGYADVDVVGSGRDLKNVDTEEFIALLDGRTLPIRFRIETGIVAAVIVAPDSADVLVGGAQQFTATLLDLHGNPMVGPPVAWASSDEGVATVDPVGLATGIAPGAATITATAQGASGTAVLTVSNPNQPPVAEPDTFDAIGNFTMPVSAPGVLANDTDPDADPLQAVAGTFPTANGGTFTLNADGSFTYLGAPGFTGADEVGYEVTDGSATAASTVSFVVPTRVWYVSNAGIAPGDGRDASPFTALKSAEAASHAGETIFVLAGDGSSAGLDEGVVLKNGQSLTGQGVAANVTASLNGETVVLLAAGSAPQLTRGDVGATIALAQDNTVQGVEVASSAGPGIAGTGFGTLTVGSVSVAAAGGPSLDLSTGTVAADFAELSSAGSAGTGLRLADVGGVLAAPSGSIVGAVGTGIEVNGGNAAVSYGGSVASVGPRPVSVTGRTGGVLTLSGTIASTGQGILVQGNGGGTIAFTGPSKSLSTGTSHGVELISNAGAAVQFAGGGLSVATTTGEGFRATGGGTVSVTGPGNTLTAAGGAALRVTNTTIGAAGFTFRSISAAGGASGIVLENTGVVNGVQVTGDGASNLANGTRGRTTAGSGGGTITPGSGGTISGAGATGISVTGAVNVVLRNVVVQNNGGDGIRAFGVAGLTLDNVLVTGHPAAHGLHASDLSGLEIVHSDLGHNATAPGLVEAADIWNVRLDELSGVGSVTHSLIHHSQETVFGVVNESGVLNLTISNTSITDTGAGVGGADGLQLTSGGSATMAVALINDSIARTRARGVTASTAIGSAATVFLTVSGSHFADNTTAALELVHGSGGGASFTFTGNAFQRTGSVPINVNRQASPGFTAFGPLSGTISGNTIGTAGIAGSGTVSGNGIQVRSNGTGGSTRVAVVNNTIRRVGQHGLSISAVDAAAPGTLLEARVEGNSIEDLSPGALDGINILPGALSTDVPTVCLDLRDNTSTGMRNGLRLRPAGLPAAAPTIQLAWWDGATPVGTYIAGQNTLAGGLGPVSAAAGSGAFAAVPGCTTP